MKKLGGKYPLIVEPYPEDYTGYEFITLLKYNDETFLNIIDNVYDKEIITYVLDLCAPSGVDAELILSIAQSWFYNNKDQHPISVEFSKLQLSRETQKIMRCFPVAYVSRVIGPLPQYAMDGPVKVKKRKRKIIPKNIEFINKTRYRATT